MENIRDISVYPNPAQDVLNINAPSEAITSVYSALGEIIVLDTTEKIIDLSQLSNGVYEVVIQYNGIIIHKKIIKS